MVHGRIRDVEREARHHLVHEDAEVVAQKCACDAQRPGRRYNEDVPRGDQGIREILGFRGFEERVGRLVAESALVKAIADKTQGKDGCSKRIAGGLRVATEELRKDLIVVFYPMLGPGIDSCVPRGSRKGSSNLASLLYCGRMSDCEGRWKTYAKGDILPEERVESNGKGRD